MAIYDAPESLHVGNGVETVFGFNWPYLLPRDLLVTVNGLPVPTVLASTNQVAIVPAPAALAIVRIYRSTPAQNPTYLFATGIPMLPKYIDGNNKQLLYALQEGLLQFAQTQATADAALAAAVAAQIAAEQAAASAAQQAVDMRRTLRVPTTDAEIPALPSAPLRANKVFGFDALGNPAAMLPQTGSGTELALQLLDPAYGSNIVAHTAGPEAIPRTVARALRDTVSVLEYYDDQLPNATVRAFETALRYGKGIEVPANADLPGFNSILPVPAGRDIILYGKVSSTVAGRFDMQGSGCFFTQGGLLTNVGLKLLGGTNRVQGFTFTGRNHTQAILIQGTGTYTGLLIDDFDIYEANFGILRQGANSALNGAIVTRGRLRDLRGDGIEWNVCPNDRNMLFEDHVMDLISSVSAAQPFWGIGIGVAGSSYDNTYPDTNTAKDFIIANIRGSRCRQLVHVENGNRFEIAQIGGYDISDEYSPLSGLGHHTVVVNGSTNFAVHAVRSYPGLTGSRTAGSVSVEYGIVNSAIVSAPQNYSVRDIDIVDGAVRLNAGNKGTHVTAEDITIKGSYFEFIGRPSVLTLRNIKATRPRGRGKAILLDLDRNTDGREAFRPTKPNSLEVVDCVGRDEYMADSFSVTGMVQDKLTLKGNNFDIQTVVSRDVNRLTTGPSNGLPFGREFVRTDMFVDLSTGVRYLFTGAGSINRGSDTFTTLGANSKLVQSTNYPWTGAFHHEVGQRISLSNIGVGGVPLVTTVVRTLVGGGVYQIELADAHSAATGVAGTITAATTATYVTA